MKYIISNNGAGIAVGVVGNKKKAKSLAILSENLFNSNHSDEYFGHLIFMPSVKKFKKLITMKEYYNEWEKHWELVGNYKIKDQEERIETVKPSVFEFTKSALRSANQIMANNVTMENFMQNISNNAQTYSLGIVSAENNDEDS